jgi:hypothetical protein
MANRSRLPDLSGCKAREAHGLMSGRCADFHHGPEPTAVPFRGPDTCMHSVGVAWQCCGQMGKHDNCQVAVTLSLVNPR